MDLSAWNPITRSKTIYKNTSCTRTLPWSVRSVRLVGRATWLQTSRLVWPPEHTGQTSPANFDRQQWVASGHHSRSLLCSSPLRSVVFHSVRADGGSILGEGDVGATAMINSSSANRQRTLYFVPIPLSLLRWIEGVLRLPPFRNVGHFSFL